MKSRSVQHLHSINVQDEYGTPKDLFDKICQKYDIWPQIDICASDTNHVVDNYITKKQNCLGDNYDITKDFFMNPPYSKISMFMEFAYNQHLKNNVSCVILTYSKTGTKWWHKFVQDKADHIEFQKGRINFLDENGNQTRNPAPYDSAWIIFKKKKNELNEKFDFVKLNKPKLELLHKLENMTEKQKIERQMNILRSKLYYINNREKIIKHQIKYQSKNYDKRRQTRIARHHRTGEW